MGNMHLVTGYLGQEHVTASDQGAFNAALIGRGQFVLGAGKTLEAQIISSNQIRILDGELMMQGRFIRLEPGSYVDLNIDNGVQGKKRNDLIAVRYTKDNTTGVESANLVVIKGTASTGNPVDPAHKEADITTGAAATHEYPLWRIPIEGISVGEPVSLFGEPLADSLLTLPGLRADVNAALDVVGKVYDERTNFVSLKEGTSIPANTDLNTLLTIGNHRCINGNTVATLLNCPTRQAFKMVVGYDFLYSGDSGKFEYQEIVDSDGDVYWRRTSDGGATWDPWRHRFDDSMTIPIENGGTGANTIKDVRQAINYLGSSPITTPDDDTVSAWVEYGTCSFYVSKSGCLKGQPAPYGFVQQRVSSNGYIHQVWISQQRNARMFKRTGTLSDGWYTDDWSAVFDTTQTVPVENGGTGAVTAEAARANLGAATIAHGSYTGTGTAGVDNPTTLTFEFTPKFVIIEKTYVDMQMESDIGIDGDWIMLVNGVQTAGVDREANNTTTTPLRITWSDNAVSMYHDYNPPWAGSQMNQSGHVYHYVAIG